MQTCSLLNINLSAMSLQAIARGKRKKSGAEYRRKKLARIDEEEKLSSFMVDFLKNSVQALHDDDVATIYR